MLKGLVPFIKAQEIESLCQNLAKQITKEYRDLEPVLIAPLRGSIFFLNQLIRYLDFPLQVDFISISSGGGVYRIRKDVALKMENRPVLIVIGIMDTGQKAHFVRERVMISKPASIKIVSLLDKPSRRSLSIHSDYVGRQIDDRFVVGCGMDADELGRNYKDIYIFAQ